MRVVFDRVVGDRRLVAVVSERDDGDIHPRRVDSGDLDRRQRAVAGSRWAMSDQVHGTEVVHVDAPTMGWPSVGTADVMVTHRPHRRLAVWAADCAPIAMFGGDGAVAMIHGGWRGLAAGIVDVAVETVGIDGRGVDAVAIGPLIHPCCYPFGAEQLAEVATGVGAAGRHAISATTTSGDLALDVPAALRVAFGRHGIALDAVGPCTGCDHRWFSHRARAEPGRHALVAWNEPAPVAS